MKKFWPEIWRWKVNCKSLIFNNLEVDAWVY